MRILLFLFVSLLTLNISYANDFPYNEITIKSDNILFNEKNDEETEEEEPDCE